MGKAATAIATDTAPQNVRMMALDDLEAAAYNPRTISDEALEGLKASIETFGLVQPIVWNERTKRIVGGHQRVEAMRQQGATEAMVVVVDFDETKERLLNLTLNNAAIAGEFTPAALEQLRELEEEAGFAALRLEELQQQLTADLEALESGDPAGGNADPEAARLTLRERFGVPPFSVLDARQGYWQDRKRAWLALGIKSELGRGGGQHGETARK